MLHDCVGRAPHKFYGPAFDQCKEEEESGRFWVDNGEYKSQVNYCPYCGAKAPKQIGES